jgi:hypothetical protein
MTVHKISIRRENGTTIFTKYLCDGIPLTGEQTGIHYETCRVSA